MQPKSLKFDYIVKGELYTRALNYAKEHGVLVYAEAKHLLEMIEKEDIKGLEFNQALVSKRSIQVEASK